MFPILYEQISAGVVPQNNGLGTLTDCISCEIEQERNGAFELVMKYPINGIHAQELAERRIIKAKPNFTDPYQLFRIDRIGATMNSVFTVYAKHISYDLSGYEITSGTAGSAVAACLLLQGAASGYTIDTDKSVTADFKITEPASVRSYFGGRKGSFLDVFGSTEIKYDNFHVSFLLHAGQDRGVTIRYSKNLLELSQEKACSNLYTHVMCYYKDDEGVVSGSKVATGLTLDVPKTLIVDLSSEYESAPSVADLTADATQYIADHNLTTPTNNIKLDFVQSGNLVDRVDLCDTVSVYYEALGITRAQVKCIRTVYDCINERYVETEFGDPKTNITDTFVAAQKQIAEKPSTTAMETAIQHATELITGNLGGYVVFHDANSDGEPDEILIMDTNDISTATKVWRWNSGGLAYSTAGYSGPYETAITADGEIVADFITTGTLNANIIKAGVISDVNNNSSIDLATGVATLFQLAAKAYCYIKDADTDDTLAELRAGLNGGVLGIFNRSNNAAFYAYSTADGTGSFEVRNANGSIRMRGFVGSTNDDGLLDVSDGSGNVTVSLVGQGGHIEQKGGAVSLWTGTLYNGDFQVADSPYTSYIVKWRVSNSGNYMTMQIPRADITTTRQGYQFNTEAQYYSFGVTHDTSNNKITFEFISRSTTSTGHICAVYGVY